MSTSFNASAVSCDPIEGVWTVAFSEYPAADGRYLLLQREEQEAAHEKELGLVGDYIELDDQSRAAYGGVESVALKQDKLTLLLNAKGIHLVGVREVEVSFDLVNPGFDKLHAALEQILGRARVYVT
jgi:hypothetical protein